MAKSKKTEVTDKVQRPVLTAVFVAYVSYVMSNSTSQALSDATNFAFQLSGGLLFFMALTVFLERRTITHQKIIRYVGFFVSLFLVLFGWKLCSYAVPPENFQSDGYNVTGGFLMLTGGIYWGYDYARERMLRGKK